MRNRANTSVSGRARESRGDAVPFSRASRAALPRTSRASRHRSNARRARHELARDARSAVDRLAARLIGEGGVAVDPPRTRRRRPRRAEDGDARDARAEHRAGRDGGGEATMIVPRTKGAWRWGAGGAGRVVRVVAADSAQMSGYRARDRRSRAVKPRRFGASRRPAAPERPRGEGSGIGRFGGGGRVRIRDAGVGPRRLARRRVVKVRLAGVGRRSPYATVGGGERGGTWARRTQKPPTRREGEMCDAARWRRRHRATREGRAVADERTGSRK